MKPDYLKIKPASFSGPGIYRDNNTGEEFTVWKFKRLDGRIVYENSDGDRFPSIIELINKRGAQ